MFATLLQARKRVKSMRNASSTSSTQRPQKTGNDHVDDAFTFTVRFKMAAYDGVVQAATTVFPL